MAACIVFVSQYDPLSEEAGLNVCLEACSDQAVRLLWADCRQHLLIEYLHMPSLASRRLPVFSKHAFGLKVGVFSA